MFMCIVQTDPTSMVESELNVRKMLRHRDNLILLMNGQYRHFLHKTYYLTYQTGEILFKFETK